MCEKAYKKNELITAAVTDIEFPNIGICRDGGCKIEIKDALSGSVVSARITKKRNKKITAKIVEVLEEAPYQTKPDCPHFGICGGCCYQHVPYQKQLEIKETLVLSLLEKSGVSIENYCGIQGSPEETAYRNKMEFSFGDTGLEGELSLGMRRKSSYYEVVHVHGCKIIDDDVRAVLNETLGFFRGEKTQFYNTRKQTGVLRHLVVRQSKKYGGLLVNLVTTSGLPDETALRFCAKITELQLNGTLEGVLHTVNDSLADVVKHDDCRILYGRNWLYENVLGLNFKITPASFFQTNTLGAEVLYKKALELAGDCKFALDLYSGTGTITQLLAKNAEKAVGIELCEDAVLSAAEMAKENGVTNATFICGDVLKEIDKITESEIKPDLIVLDPPREGVHPKALVKIAQISADKIVYISCKPTSLARDLSAFSEHGYTASHLAIIDMFPSCAHVESVVLLSKR